MQLLLSINRWGRRWIAWMVMGAGILVAEVATSTASPTNRKASPSQRPVPNVQATNAVRVTDELADSLEQRFRLPPKEQGASFESDNVLRRQVKKIVVDETKVWRDMMEGATNNYARSIKAADKHTAESLLVSIVENPDSPTEIKRECMKHLAQIALDGRFYSRAQQIYSQLVSRFPLDPDTPAVLYRQGILYRQIGATELALSKFHAVMSTVISLQEKDLSAYKSLVLLAQTEIADTFFMAGQFGRAADYFRRVLKLADTNLNESLVRLKLVKAVFELQDWKGVVVEGQLSLDKVPQSPYTAEVRFLISEAYKKLGMQNEALQQTMELLNTEQERSNTDPENWAYWQKRTGNKLANELYQQGDYVNALLIYEALDKLPGNDEWHSQALYQIGLMYERLFQPDRASAAYNKVLSLSTNSVPPALATAGSTNTAAMVSSGVSGGVATNGPNTTQSGTMTKTNGPTQAQPAITPPGLKLIREMAQWRLNNLRWDQNVHQEMQKLFVPNAASTNSSVSSLKSSTP